MNFVTPAIAILIPVVVFLGVGALLQQMSGTTNQPSECHVGITGGYDADRIQACSDKVGAEGRAAYRQFLTLDLVFPFIYCAAFAISLLLLWDAWGRPISAAWLLAPLLLLIVADWTENLILLDVFRNLDSGLIDARVVHYASIATVTKVSLFVASSLATIGGSVVLLVQRIRG